MTCAVLRMPALKENLKYYEISSSLVSQALMLHCNSIVHNGVQYIVWICLVLVHKNCVNVKLYSVYYLSGLTECSNNCSCCK